MKPVGQAILHILYWHEGVWYMTNTPRLRAVLKRNATQSAWTQPLAVVYWPCTTHLLKYDDSFQSEHERHFSSSQAICNQVLCSIVCMFTRWINVWEENRSSCVCHFMVCYSGSLKFTVSDHEKNHIQEQS